MCEIRKVENCEDSGRNVCERGEMGETPGRVQGGVERRVGGGGRLIGEFNQPS